MTSTGIANVVDAADSKDLGAASKAIEGILKEGIEKGIQQGVIDEKTNSRQLDLLNYALDLNAKAKTLEKDCVLRYSNFTALIPSDNTICYIVVESFLNDVKDKYEYIEQIEVNNKLYFFFLEKY